MGRDHHARVGGPALVPEVLWRQAVSALCDVCGKPAACMGSYEMQERWAYACNECCGHGCEDGVCYPLSEIPARYQALVRRLEALEEAATSPPAASLEGPTAPAVNIYAPDAETLADPLGVLMARPRPA
jgi:hypothetical protein